MHGFRVFDAYLHKPVENVKAPLKWWISNCHLYPNLYRMVLDYLSIPSKLFLSTSHSITNCILGSHINSCQMCLFARPPAFVVHSESPLCLINLCFSLPWFMGPQ